MYRFLIFMLFIATVHGQEKSYTLPQGEWVVVATQMKDGSKMLEYALGETDYKEYKISNNKLCVILNAIYRNTTDEFSCMSYNAMSNNVIRTSHYSFYTVEKVTADTLVLTDKDDKAAPDKLHRYTMVRREILKEKEKEKYKATTIKAGKYFTPTCNAPLDSELNKIFRKKPKEFSIAGTLVFHPKLNTLETIITASQLQDADAVATVKKVLDKSYSHWNLEEFAAYDSVELPFVLEVKWVSYFSSIRFHFFTNDIDALRLRQGSAFDKELSKAAFDEGLKAITANNYKEAIELFEYAYQLDPLNIDAIYNKAAMLYKSGDTENACLTWKEIAEMGQAEAATMWKTYCNK